MGDADARPVSWMVIERGWSVVDAADDEVGQVEEVLGDVDADIFSGLSVLPGALARRLYVPAEDVEWIVEGRIRLSVTRDEVREDDREG